MTRPNAVTQILLGRILHAAMTDDDAELHACLSGFTDQELSHLATSAEVLASWARGRARKIRQNPLPIGRSAERSYLLTPDRDGRISWREQ